MGNSATSRDGAEVVINYCSILVIGDVKSGKTSLINRFVADKFEPDNNGVRDVHKKSVERKGRYVTVYLTEEDTDTIKEKTKVVSNNNAYMLVYSVTSQESFEKIESTFNHLKTHRDNPIVILVATKVDSETRVVSTAQGAELAKQHGWNFLETSAKENINVTKAFSKIIRMCPTEQMTQTTTPV